MISLRLLQSVSTREEHAQIGSPQDFAAFKARYGRSYSSPDGDFFFFLFIEFFRYMVM